MHKRVWAISVLLAMTLAGCSEDAAPGDETDETFDDFELEATEDTGIIRGVVVDAAIVPIADVTITIEETGAQATSNANGAFGFDDLEPGAYFLTADKAGFGSVQQSAVVEANVAQPPVLKILMEHDPSTEPYASTTPFNGFIACSVTSPTASAMVCGVGYGPAQLSDVTGNDFMSTLNYDRTPSWVQAEMVWESTQHAGADMSLSFTENTQGSQTNMASAAGTSPLMISFDEALFTERNLTGHDIWLRAFSTELEGTDQVDEWIIHDAYAANLYGSLNDTGVVALVEDNRCIPLWGCENNPFAEECVKYPTLFNACLRAGGAGVTLQQKYELFATTFYNLTPKEGWMYSTDGQYPTG